ncbi:MAG: hypothetical protein IT440_13140 [Phycisphaeraceae bacterium]|nr:hypothetical protein [Phycisphaeraceae bacterium]
MTTNQVGGHALAATLLLAFFCACGWTRAGTLVLFIPANTNANSAAWVSLCQSNGFALASVQSFKHLRGACYDTVVMTKASPHDAFGVLTLAPLSTPPATHVEVVDPKTRAIQYVCDLQDADMRGNKALSVLAKIETATLAHRVDSNAALVQQMHNGPDESSSHVSSDQLIQALVRDPRFCVVSTADVGPWNNLVWKNHRLESPLAPERVDRTLFLNVDPSGSSGSLYVYVVTYVKDEGRLAMIRPHLLLRPSKHPAEACDQILQRIAATKVPIPTRWPPVGLGVTAFMALLCCVRRHLRAALLAPLAIVGVHGLYGLLPWVLQVLSQPLLGLATALFLVIITATRRRIRPSLLAVFSVVAIAFLFAMAPRLTPDSGQRFRWESFNEAFLCDPLLYLITGAYVLFFSLWLPSYALLKHHQRLTPLSLLLLTATILLPIWVWITWSLLPIHGWSTRPASVGMYLSLSGFEIAALYLWISGDPWRQTIGVANVNTMKEDRAQ